MSEGFRIHLENDFMACSDKLYIIKEENGKRYVAKPLEFEEVPEGHIVLPTFQCYERDGIFPQMKSELNKLGLLHNADQASNEALKYHLEDMRTIVFKQEKDNG